jgi:hypothetical protein
VIHVVRTRVLSAVVACLAVAAVAQPASGEMTVHPRIGEGLASGVAIQRDIAAAQPTHGAQPPKTSPGSQSPSKTTATVACKRLRHNQIRCTMTIKGGAGISGTVAMRITRGKLVVALGHGRLRRGTATLTMRVLRRMTPGLYTVTMVVTRATINAKMVLRLS